ncbi:MAG: NAD-dependent dihydropyrimidine dehydrogenase subunit PreA [Bacteroidetes bacterium]|nr:NAD-dependent dihydropyrimidine dehydrogenase subunit PreA [Bacteroidota bacterium]MBU1677289.1 NAD-dependent dihydropyrimidine dehydrogenase subunit PreA [Bacteroidota bacterium]MBU2506362.1 NAD-dependent dihydropyrimidine dehydrogenase subunit PreA [Bacteroidota bacterium]
MIDLSINFAGIKSPNPFWLASAPPSNSAYQNCKAFEEGWGGTVWKTIGEPVMNVCNRYGGLDYNGQKLVGLNNVELISDRSNEVNFKEIAETKKLWPDRAVIVSLMVESKRETWHDIVKRTIDTGCDGLELNYGCPHGMSERGMGSAVGQVPEYCKMITEWVTEVSTIPVLVKLTPNIGNIQMPARAAKAGGAAGIALINTINSIMGVDLNTFELRPSIAGKSGHGGLAGPIVKPIALNMVSQVAIDKEVNLPISGIGGISNWRDALEFILLGSTSVQVCTAVMHYGFRIVKDMKEGLSFWMEEKGFTSLDQVRGKALPQLDDFGNFNLLHKTVARIDQDKCIHCNLCHIACEDGAHQCIDLISENGKSRTVVREEDCVGCDLCSIICPVEGCISMVRVDDGKETKTWNELVTDFKKENSELTWKKLRAFQKKFGIEIH